MKLNKQNIYTNSTKTNQYNPETGKAWSYGWYQYAHLVGDILYIAVMNEKGSKYSVTTAKHITQLRNLLCNVEVRYVCAPEGLAKLKSYESIEVLA